MSSHSFLAIPVPSAKETHRPTQLRAGAACLALMLAGCAVGPEYAGPPRLDMPAHWSAKPASRRQTGTLDRWWLRLRDPLLNRLIEQAVEANPDVAKAKAAVREARATVQQTSAGLFPSVSGTASVTVDRAGDRDRA
ncbi:TolC family protein [Bradyrhizobium betae]|uniref:TolC family protein n=1 Tax=Bradyrhizobium betae TaxID=244734 RepID=UPI001FCE68AE|nr:TolC family protein [Bradyrhizobium betae]MCS3726644.1 outer membrane protein TolC [Bradyrhizobium betae]